MVFGWQIPSGAMNAAACVAHLFFVNCYNIAYRHSKGVFVASKWAESASDALEAVKKAHKRVGLSSAVGAIVYDKAELVIPQPFSDESRALRALQAASDGARERAAPALTIDVDFSARDEPEPVAEEEPEAVAVE
jgi:hypothetical protein